VAGDEVTLSVRDVDGYVAWRFRTPPVPSSPLFPRRQLAPLSAEARDWAGRVALGEGRGTALVLAGFRPDTTTEGPTTRPIVSMTGGPGRLLVPVVDATHLRLRSWAPAPGLELQTRVNGRDAPLVRFEAGWSETVMPADSSPWREGWNVLELWSPSATGSVAVDWLAVEPPEADR
jgi:hypothetical protein